MCNGFTRITINNNSLDDSDFVGDIKGVVIRGESDVRLLGSQGSNQGVDLLDGDLVQLLDGLLDLVLVGTQIDDEDKGVGVLKSMF